MNIEITNVITSNILLYGLLALVISSLFSLYFVPTIRKLAYTKNLTDNPSARKSHSKKVPVLGGLAVFLAASFTMMPFAFFFHNVTSPSTYFLLAFASTTMLFVGILDDIVSLKPMQKLFFQIVVSVLVIYVGSFFIGSMDGLFGVNELNTPFSFVLAFFIYIVFINMLNLIDGIDGLASGISVIAFVFFALVAHETGNYNNMLVAMCGLGSLIPFMYFNMFSNKKIFLGDNGSLVLGVILGYLALDLLSVNIGTAVSLFGTHKILILMAVFSYPLVDTLRVFVVRISRKRSPFAADKNHIHHHLLRLGLSHRKATLVVIIYSIFIITIAMLLVDVNINIAFVVLLSIAIFTICLPSLMVKNSKGVISLKFASD